LSHSCGRRIAQGVAGAHGFLSRVCTSQAATDATLRASEQLHRRVTASLLPCRTRQMAPPPLSMPARSREAPCRRRSRPSSSPTRRRARARRSCGPASTAASAPPPARPTSSSATSSTVPGAAST
jgi:hypothetical protein